MMVDRPVLIVSDHSDAHVPMVARQLEQLGVPFAEFNTSDFPLRVRLSLSYLDAESRSTLYLPGDRALNCSNVRSIWYRKPEPYELSSAVPIAQRDFANAECREAVHGMYNLMRGKLWIDDPVSMRRVSNKPLQIDIARRLGFEVPHTLITNDPSLAREFYAFCGGNVVYKTLSCPRVTHNDDGQTSDHRLDKVAAYTTLVDTEDPDLWKSIELAPCLFQEHVPKRFELRVTVVGDEVFAAEIDSQSDPATIIDWRRGDILNLKHRIHALPEAIADLCRSLLRALGLNFGAIDIILTPDLRYVFLEINPNGQYGWIEYLTGLQISSAIAMLLASE
jgi:glutathione synthase/RimK-type ligase-like ATP-grasp enzyme